MSRASLFAWAFPTGSVDQLLQVAATPCEDSARHVWQQWLQANQLDAVGFCEMRLLAHIVPRLERIAPSSAEHKRLVQSTRLLWAQSHAAIAEIRPALQILHREGIEMMAFKGAARLVQDPRAIKTRVLNDFDLLVRPNQFERAFDLLTEAGWRATLTGSTLYHRAILRQLHGLNLIRGRFGDLDLHRSAFHAPYGNLDQDARIWQRAQPGRLGELRISIPCPTDAVVIALAHGGLDGHTTSDWLLDIVHAIQGRQVDWELLVDLVDERQLEVAAAVAFSYIARRLHIPVPQRVLQHVSHRAHSRIPRLLNGLLSAHPKESLNPPFRLARGIAKLWRLHGPQRHIKAEKCSTAGTTTTGTCWGRACWNHRPGEWGEPATSMTIATDVAADGSTWTGAIDLTVVLEAPATARRIEFEINTPTRHLVRLRYRKLGKSARTMAVRFRTPELTLGPDDTELRLQAVPGRGLRSESASPLQIDRYAPLPFRLVSCQFRGATGEPLPGAGIAELV